MIEPNFTGDYDGEMERQWYESPRETAYRHLKEENEYRKTQGYQPVKPEEYPEIKDMEDY